MQYVENKYPYEDIDDWNYWEQNVCGKCKRRDICSCEIRMKLACFTAWLKSMDEIESQL